jgi:hypothetical protein
MLKKGDRMITIFKEPVMYLISTKVEMMKSEDCFINTIPVIMNTCDYPDSQDINGDTIRITPKEQIVGIIPAPVGMFQVCTSNDKGNIVILGFEYPNHVHPDWVEVVKQALK